jgi:hypothetical protein
MWRRLRAGFRGHEGIVFSLLLVSLGNNYAFAFFQLPQNCHTLPHCPVISVYKNRRFHFIVMTAVLHILLQSFHQLDFSLAMLDGFARFAPKFVKQGQALMSKDCHIVCGKIIENLLQTVSVAALGSCLVLHDVAQFVSAFTKVFQVYPCAAQWFFVICILHLQLVLKA